MWTHQQLEHHSAFSLSGPHLLSSSLCEGTCWERNPNYRLLLPDNGQRCLWCSSAEELGPLPLPVEPTLLPVLLQGPHSEARRQPQLQAGSSRCLAKETRRQQLFHPPLYHRNVSVCVNVGWQDERRFCHQENIMFYQQEHLMPHNNGSTCLKKKMKEIMEGSVVNSSR